MSLNLEKRVDALERSFGFDESQRIVVVINCFGSEVTHAKVCGKVIERLPGEDQEAFRDRACAVAEKTRELLPVVHLRGEVV